MVWGGFGKVGVDEGAGGDRRAMVGYWVVRREVGC